MVIFIIYQHFNMFIKQNLVVLIKKKTSTSNSNITFIHQHHRFIHNLSLNMQWGRAHQT
jgi:hypothetical protein